MINGFYTIIDGYNLIFQCGLEGRSRSSRSLERARNRVISTLAQRLDGDERAGTAIVYDANVLPIRETQAVSQRSGITVIYAVDEDDADSLIEEMIRYNATPKQLTVVSSDHRIHQAARRRKSHPIDSDQWWESIEKPVPEGSLPDHPASEKTIPDSLKEIDWQSEFRIADLPEATGDGSSGDGSSGDGSSGDGSSGEGPIENPFPPGYGDDLLD